MHDKISTASNVTPAVVGAWWTSITLNEWVSIALLIYFILKIGLLVPDYITLFSREHAKLRHPPRSEGAKNE